ncbi:MAG: polyprenyl synthetase family protein [Planctomycetota bacterium]
MTPLASSPPSTSRTAIDAALTDVARRFEAELASDLPCVQTLADQAIRYRGKMLRPQLVLAVGAVFNPDALGPDPDERLAVAAAVVEMIHLATLVHDDVLDEADLRRSGPTLRALHGNEAAVMLGDYLISHAYRMCTRLDAPGRESVSGRMAAVTNTVCEGELLQLEHRGDWALSERTYLEIVRRKTGALTGACCALPQWLDPEPNPALARELYAFGEKLGVAFQIADDVLDLAGDPDRLGKPLGQDLAAGKLTLPWVCYFQQALPADAADTRQLIQSIARDPRGAQDESDPQAGSPPTGDAFGLALQRLRRSGALEQAEARAQAVTQDAAKWAQSSLPPSPALDMLLQMVGRVAARRY